MMKSRFFKVTMTHALALGLGLVGAKIASSSTTSEPESAAVLERAGKHRVTRQAREDRFSSPVGFRAAFSELNARSMTRYERAQCEEDLWRQWGDSDPAGLLAFLETHRVWPENFNLYGGQSLTGRPDLLLDFALRNGSSDAIRSLGYAHLPTVSALLAALPESQKGEEIVSLEKQIDQQLGESGIEVSEETEAYKRGVAEALLNEGRLEDFFEALGEIGDPDQAKELAKKLGEVLAEEPLGEKAMDQLSRLPETLQKEAAFRLMSRGNRVGMEFPEVRAERRRWIKRFAEEGWVDAAMSGIHDLFRDEEAASQGEEWAAWLEQLPNNETWQPITEVIFRQWSGDNAEEMVRQICALPASPTRERMANAAAAATIGNLAQPFDDKDTWIFGSLAALHSDGEKRARFEAEFGPYRPSEEDPYPFGNQDPFAFDDPFANEGE